MFLFTKRLGTYTPLLASLVLGGWVGTASAAVVISVDLDTSTPLVADSVRTVAPGELFTVGLIMAADAAGVSSYSISVNFDTGELSLDGSPAASYPTLPSGLGPGTAPAENNGLGRAWSFQGFTPGAGPVSSSFVFGNIKFQAVTPLTDGLVDVNPGFFNLPGSIDSLFDNVGNPVVPVFNGARVNVVPEPGSFICLAAGVLALALRRRSS